MSGTLTTFTAFDFVNFVFWNAFCLSHPQVYRKEQEHEIDYVGTFDESREWLKVGDVSRSRGIVDGFSSVGYRPFDKILCPNYST